jgi:hypothetical protein
VKKQFNKRIPSIILVLSILLSLFVTSVFAASALTLKSNSKLYFDEIDGMKLIMGVGENQSVSSLLSNFNKSNEIVVKNDNKVISGNESVGTGTTVSLNDDFAYIVVNGDTDGDGENEQVNQLLVMPQLIPEDASVVVKYTVNGSERTKTAKLKGWKDLSDNVVDEWNLGVRYTYRLVYGASAADKDRIYFAPGTEEWIEHDVIVIQL